jgi:hypothetical protein
MQQQIERANSAHSRDGRPVDARKQVVRAVPCLMQQGDDILVR